MGGEMTNEMVDEFVKSLTQLGGVVKELMAENARLRAGLREIAKNGDTLTREIAVSVLREKVEG